MNTNIFRTAEQRIKQLENFALFQPGDMEIFNEMFLEIERIQPDSDYMQFLKAFNQITGKKYTATIISRDEFYKTAYEYSLPEKVQAVKNAITDTWTQGDKTTNVKDIIRPEWILERKNLSKYINFVAPKKDSKELKINKTDFNQPANI